MDEHLILIKHSSHMRKISEEGVRFQSPINGDTCFLTPEESMRIQHILNSDIVMIFDECTPYPADEPAANASMELSVRWAERSRRGHDDERNPNALFGIIQGGMQWKAGLSLELIIRRWYQRVLS